MKTSTFFAMYPNTPLKDREKPINSSGLTLSDIYFRVKQLENEIRPARIEIDKLLSNLKI